MQLVGIFPEPLDRPDLRTVLYFPVTAATAKRRRETASEIPGTGGSWRQTNGRVMVHETVCHFLVATFILTHGFKNVSAGSQKSTKSTPSRTVCLPGLFVYSSIHVKKQKHSFTREVQFEQDKTIVWIKWQTQDRATCL